MIWCQTYMIKCQTYQNRNNELYNKRRIHLVLFEFIYFIIFIKKFLPILFSFKNNFSLIISYNILKILF